MDRRSGKWERASEDTQLLLKRDMSVESTTAMENPVPSLTFSQKLAYGVGHVLNDNCAAVWFSYTLLYFQVVMGMPQSMTGSLLLVGQVVDAVATPIVGIFADRTGRRIIWHLTGTIMTVVSFPLIFMCWPSYANAAQTDSSEPSLKGAWMIGLYYTLLIIVFQIGWAVVQIAHLALIPIMTPLQSERAELTAIRFSASICSSIFMYLVTWFILHVTHEKKTTDVESGKKSALGPADAYKFRDIVLIGLAIGGVFAAWFHIFLKVPDDAAKTDGGKAMKDSAAMKSGIKSYLTSVLLYQVSILYVSSRLFLTLSLVYMPLYLVENAGEDAEFLATVPLVSYIASFVSSIIIKQLNPCIGSKIIYLIGGVASILGCIWIGIGLGRLNLSGELFSVAILLGALWKTAVLSQIFTGYPVQKKKSWKARRNLFMKFWKSTGSSITMVSSLCLTADFIGTQTEHGAFIYSVVTFADKLLNGIVVMIIEELKCKDCRHYYQDVLAYACGATVLIGILALVSMQIYPLSFVRLKETIKNLRISRN